MLDKPAVVPVAQLHRGGADLFEDLRRRQVAGQPALPRRAERARHPAAGLRRDAHRVALRVAHQHRLERRAVDRPPQHLARLAGVALDLAHRVEQAREQRVGDLFAHRGGQIGHLARIGDQPAVVLVGQLLTAKCGQPEFRDGVSTARLVEVGEVAWRHRASRRVENQGQGGGHGLLSVSHPWLAEIDWR